MKLSDYDYNLPTSLIAAKPPRIRGCSRLLHLDRSNGDITDKLYADLPSILKGNTSIMIAETANGPAKIIKEFRKKGKKPVLKGAFINNEIYIGDDQLDALVSIKSKEEVIGEIIGLLQSPAQRVIAALQNQIGKEETAE